MARPWSARCYGVARQREGSRQNSIGGSGVLSLRHFGLVLFIPWRVGAEEFAAAKDANYGLWFRPARCCSTGSGRLDLDLLISGPRVNLFHHPYAREGADGQAVVCPLLRGSSPTRGVAPKQHRTRRLLTNRPCSSLVYEESDSKERLRVSNWIVQKLYNYAVKKTVEL